MALTAAYMGGGDVYTGGDDMELLRKLDAVSYKCSSHFFFSVTSKSCGSLKAESSIFSLFLFLIVRITSMTTTTIMANKTPAPVQMIARVTSGIEGAWSSGDGRSTVTMSGLGLTITLVMDVGVTPEIEASIKVHYTQIDMLVGG